MSIDQALRRCNEGKRKMAEGKRDLAQVFKELRKDFPNEQDLSQWLERHQLPTISETEALLGRSRR